MTTSYCLKKPQAIFFKTTSSPLKLANCSTHGGETWYACLLHHFHDDHNNEWPQTLFFTITFLHSSNLLTVACMVVKLGTHAYYIVSMTTTTTIKSLRNFSLQLLLHSLYSLKVAHMDLKITSSLLKLTNGSMHLEMKLGTHAYYIISMTTTCFCDDYILFK